MARIRSLKPDIFLHRKAGRLTNRQFRLFVGLITHADDEGRQVADAGQLRALFFGLLQDITDDDIEADIQEIAKTKMVVLYSFNNVRYVSLPSWSEHQVIHINHRRPSMFPPPPDESRTSPVAVPDYPWSSPGQVPDESRTSPGQIPDRSRTSPGQVPPDRKGVEGNGNTFVRFAKRASRETRSHPPGLFEDFWNNYPAGRRRAKAKARDVWARVVGGNAELAARVIADVAARAVSDHEWTKDGGKYVPHPHRYLTGRRWEDEVVSGPTPDQPKPGRYNQD